MKLTKMLGMASLAMTVSVSYSVMAADSATIDEVKAKVTEAAKSLAEKKDKGLAGFDKAWTWKDTYVFVYDCKADKAVVHPKLKDKPIMDIKDKAGNLVFGGDKGLCKAGEQAGGGWVVYMWPKPGSEEPAPKATFAMKVEGTDYQVAAGIYADKKVENFQLKD
jgi:signal transduction histidine kinase